MEYRRLGRSGLKVSELGFGSWLTFGNQLDVHKAQECMKRAFNAGVNLFDNAEVYGKGRSEEVMGHALAGFRREDLVISTKIYWGGDGPNDKGLSWKHLVEGTRASLKRMAIGYVDILFCHRADPDTPLDEICRAINHLIAKGDVLYWGTSEWPAERVEEAILFCQKNGLISPIVEQPQYNLLARDRIENDFVGLFEKYELGTTIWSPLASGVLTGKYLDGIPEGSRLAQNEWMKERLTPDINEKVRRLKSIADDLSVTLSQLSLAWCLTQPGVTSVLIGATSVQQLEENLVCLSTKELLTEAVRKQIMEIVDKA